MDELPNVFTTSFEFDRGGARVSRVGTRAGADALGASVYELDPGARWADLHVHYANEEMIVVLAGRPTLHTLEGSRDLVPGEVVACLRGRRGAHRLENSSDEVARVLIVSTRQMPELVEYPERGDVFAMSEPPFTDAPLDESYGRVLRVFHKDDAFAVPPDEKPPS